MASVETIGDQISVERTINGHTSGDQADGEQNHGGETNAGEDAPAEQHLHFSLDLDRPPPSEPSPTSSIFNVLGYVSAADDCRHISMVEELVEKSTKAIYLTQKTSLKIALLIDAITKKQNSFLRRLTRRVKPDPEVITLQEHLGSLQQEEDLWSKICSSALSESVRMKKELEENPEVFKAMIKARTDLLRIDREIRTNVVEPLKLNLIDGSRPNYTVLRTQTETLGAEAVGVCKAICLQLISVNPQLREALEAKRREGGFLESNGASVRRESIIVPSKLRGLSQQQLLDAISIL